MAIAYNRAREQVDRVKRHRDKCLIIHYACQSLYDDREGLSPSVSNIVVKDFASDQTMSFAAHFTAEKLHIPREEIPARFDEIERSLLDEFYQFVQSRTGSLWLHWNMINIHYGFEMLAHRYYVLTGKNAPSIDIDNRINIASILQGIYGENYVPAPHMPKLMNLNGGMRRDFVSGADEVGLFRNHEYAKLYASTASKVRFFSDVLELVIDRKLRVEEANTQAKLERAADGIIAKFLGLAAALYTIVDLALRFWPKHH